MAETDPARASILRVATASSDEHKDRTADEELVVVTVWNQKCHLHCIWLNKEDKKKSRAALLLSHLNSSNCSTYLEHGYTRLEKQERRERQENENDNLAQIRRT